MREIRIGTRGSKLALWQAEHIAKLLQQGGIETKIVTIETTGDKILDVSIAKIGSKGVFTEEIEAQLSAGTIDIAVHSAKDMPSVLPDGFKLIAFTERELANDVLIGKGKDCTLTDQDILIGTSSTRRIAMLKHYYPQAKTVPVRGNLQTRIAKMELGDCDAMLLAYAGVKRMGYEERIINTLPLDQFTPAVGQGSVTVECTNNLPKETVEVIRQYTNHLPTETCLLAERAFLKTLEGGCSIPVFGLATLKNNQLTMIGGIISLDGTAVIRKVAIGKNTAATTIGTQLAQEVLAAGGNKILKEIKKQLL